MSTIRPILKAHRRVYNEPSKERRETSDGNSSDFRHYRAPRVKNLAAERMKRLREELALEREQSERGPPSKRRHYSNSSDEDRGNNAATSTSFRTNQESQNNGIRHMSHNEDVNITDVTYLTTNTTSPPMGSQPNTSALLLDDDDEDMDWSPVEEIRQARELLIRGQGDGQARTEGDTNVRTTVLPGMSRVNVNVVVDTNIFMDKLQTVTNIMHLYFNDNSYPVIYVPWMVIQELDYFKDGYSVSELHPMSKMIQVRCRKAIKFINNCLLSQKPNFRGQPVHLAANSVIGMHRPDDSILSCCVQLQLERFEVILLSSDINLRNKAMISNVKACAPSEIIKLLCKDKIIVERRSFAKEISKQLSLICTFVLHFEIQDYLGERLYASKHFKPLPWIFKDCVIYMRQYYDAVLAPKVHKQCLKHVNDLHELLTSGEEITNDFKFMESCLSLLIFLQTGFPKYNENIQRTINMIKSLEDEFSKA